MIRIRLYILLVLMLITTQASFGQVSIVPMSHQVYEWLHMQRVKGNITNYSYESLPLTRKQINSYLDQIEQSVDLNGIDQDLLKWYVQEFSVKQLKIDSKETYLQGWENDVWSSAKSKVEFLFSDKEPHLFAFYSDSMHWVVDYSFGGGTLFVDDPLNYYNLYDFIDYKTFRTYGTIYDKLGAHAEISNPYSYTLGQLRYHPEWGQTFDGRLESKQSTFYVEAFATFQYKQLGIHIGNGDIKVGNRGNEAPILRQEAGNFDWIRVNFDTKYLQYTFIHGALKTETIVDEVEGFPGVNSKTSPDRWIALRRVQITPASWITMAFTESLIYSNRTTELAYLNPLLPLRFGEFEALDKDNPLWFFDGSLRPFRNLEIYSTIGIDDLSTFSDIFKLRNRESTATSKLSYQAGLNVVLPTSTKINAEVIRFDPYFYTHKFLLNTYDELGSPLGASIGPNSQQFYFSIRQWLPWRSFVEVSFASSKKGFNILDDNGDLLRDVGGDLFNPQQNSNIERIRFMDGDIHRWNTYRIKLEVEPFRGIKVFADYRRRIMIKGNQLDNYGILIGGLEVYFYPLVQKYLNKIPIINKAF